MQPLSVDLSGALERTLGPGRGLPASALEAEVARLADLPSWMEAERAAGRADWFDLPLDEDHGEVSRFAFEADLQTGALQNRPDPRVDGGPVMPVRRRSSGQAQILARRERQDQFEVLVHHPDAKRHGI